MTILGFIKKEFAQTLRDPRMVLFLFVAPIIQLTLFGLAITTEVKNIRLAVIAKPHDTIAAQIEQKAIASGWFKQIIPQTTDISNPQSFIDNRLAEVVLVAPLNGFAKSLANQNVNIQLLIDATNLARARSIENYINQIIQDNLKSQQQLDSQNGLTLTVPYTINTRLLYNPSLVSAFFMVPAVMTMLINLVTILLTSMSLAKEKELGTIETIISSPLSKFEILVGKTLPFFILASMNFPIIMLVSHLGFDVPIRGSLLWLGVSTITYIFTTVCIGVFISTLAKTQQQSMMGGFIFLFPAMLLSGAFFPVENLPFWIKPLAYINPQTYYLSVLRNILLKGGSNEFIIFNVTMTALIGVIIFILSVNRFKQQLN